MESSLYRANRSTFSLSETKEGVDMVKWCSRCPDDALEFIMKVETHGVDMDGNPLIVDHYLWQCNKCGRVIKT